MSRFIKVCRYERNCELADHLKVCRFDIKNKPFKSTFFPYSLQSLSPPIDVYEEHTHCRRAPAPIRVEKMFEIIKEKLDRPPEFILCILPERKNSDLYGSVTYKYIYIYMHIYHIFLVSYGLSF